MLVVRGRTNQHMPQVRGRTNQHTLAVRGRTHQHTLGVRGRTNQRTLGVLGRINQHTLAVRGRTKPGEQQGDHHQDQLLHDLHITPVLHSDLHITPAPHSDLPVPNDRTLVRDQIPPNDPVQRNQLGIGLLTLATGPIAAPTGPIAAPTGPIAAPTGPIAAPTGLIQVELTVRIFLEPPARQIVPPGLIFQEPATRRPLVGPVIL